MDGQASADCPACEHIPDELLGRLTGTRNLNRALANTRTDDSIEAALPMLASELL